MEIGVYFLCVKTVTQKRNTANSSPKMSPSEMYLVGRIHLLIPKLSIGFRVCACMLL